MKTAFALLLAAAQITVAGLCAPARAADALGVPATPGVTGPEAEPPVPPLVLQPPAAQPGGGDPAAPEKPAAQAGPDAAGVPEAAAPPQRAFADVPTDDSGYVQGDKIEFFLGGKGEAAAGSGAAAGDAAGKAPGAAAPVGQAPAAPLGEGLYGPPVVRPPLPSGEPPVGGPAGNATAGAEPRAGTQDGTQDGGQDEGDAVITLARACKLAIQNHPRIDSASADYDEARADYGIARSVYYPRLDWSTKVGPSTEVDTGETENGDSALLMTHKLYQFGGLRDTVASARLRFEGAEIDYEGVCEDIAMLAINAYLAVLQAEELVRVHQGALEFYVKLLSSFQERYIAGISSRADAKKVEVSLRDAQAQLVRQNEQLSTSRTLLANIIGHPVEAVEPDVGLLRVAITASLEDAVANAMQSNKKLKALDRQIESQRKSVDASRADHYPTIGYRLQVKNEFQKMHSPDEFTQTMDAQVTIDWNLFSGFSTTHEVLKKKAALRRLKASRRSIELEIRNTLTDALNSYGASEEEHKLAREAFDSSVSLMGLYLSEFDLGIRTLLDLTAAREGQTSAAVREVNARFTRIRAAVNILLEEGRLGTTLDLALNK
ncbi:MAG: TolC family protein [Desulfovibrionaceae bacterium]|nr:TolC family protein [Desulfovibrionaceae bacterium]